jgi:hypothetical protein
MLEVLKGEKVMKKLGFLLLTVFLFSFNYAYSKKDCKLLAFKRTDYTCLYDCLDDGYSYGYCKELCSYDTEDLYDWRLRTDYKCLYDCLDDGYSYSYCKYICSY